MTASRASNAFHAPMYAYVACILTSVVFFGAVVLLDRQGQWFLCGVTATLSSYGAMAYGRMAIEHQSLEKLFDLTLASKAFVPGDLGLGLMVMAASYLRSRDDWGGRGTSLRWALIAYAIGWSIALAWHFASDGPNYRRAGAEALLSSPTKLIHDLTTYSALGAAVVFVALPVLFHVASMQSAWWWLALASGLLWVLGAVLDSRPNALNPYDLHPVYNWDTHRVVSFHRP